MKADPMWLARMARWQQFLRTPEVSQSEPIACDVEKTSTPAPVTLSDRLAECIASCDCPAEESLALQQQWLKERG